LKKLSIIRFKPKPECYEEFLVALKNRGTDAQHIEHRIVRCDDEVVAISIRDADKLAENAKQGVEWLDGHRHLLQEWNDVDRHTLAMTGDLVED
jgi:hypothetical protein|tara:strand:+ start:146 stop:427 length:282 start_codon:yes stop_codon:yes gene_type:complete